LQAPGYARKRIGEPCLVCGFRIPTQLVAGCRLFLVWALSAATSAHR